jgi:hypothetical protein
MNPPQLWTASVPVFLRYLERLRGWLDLAQGHATGSDAQRLLGARLNDDMNPFETQVVIAANFALRACHPLAGRPIPSVGEPGPGFDGLRAMIDRVASLLRDLPPALFEDAGQRTLESRAGDALVRLPAAEFLQLYALPNFFFHLTTAYAILRSQGVPIGKADFDGFHVYPRPAPSDALAARRDAEIESGRSLLVPGGEVIARLRRELD